MPDFGFHGCENKRQGFKLTHKLTKTKQREEAIYLVLLDAKYLWDVNGKLLRATKVSPVNILSERKRLQAAKTANTRLEQVSVQLVYASITR